MRRSDGGPIPPRERSPSTEAADSDIDELDGEAKLVVRSGDAPDEKWLVRWPPASGEEVGTFKWVDPRDHFGANAAAMREAHAADAARAEKQLSERTNSKKGASSLSGEMGTDGGGAEILSDLVREMILLEDALDERYVTSSFCDGRSRWIGKVVLQSDHALYADKVGVSDVVALAQARDLAEMSGRSRRDAHMHTLAQALKYLFISLFYF